VGAPAIKAELAQPTFKVATLFECLDERLKSKSWQVRRSGGASPA